MASLVRLSAAHTLKPTGGGGDGAETLVAHYTVNSSCTVISINLILTPCYNVLSDNCQIHSIK